MNFDLEKSLIFECISGSRLYGLDTEESDYDYRGVCIPPMDVMLDPFQNFEQADKFEDEDRTIYSLGKYLSLCADNNPNIVELLFVPVSHEIYSRPEWKEVVRNKDLFLSKNIKHRFTGFAVSQKKRMISHRQWLVHAPKNKPTRQEYGLSDKKKLSSVMISAINSGLDLKLLKDEYVEEYSKEISYASAKKLWDNYMSWKSGRNPKRKELEEKFGYDTKLASHLFRIMLEGKELLLDGTITFPLKEKEFIFDVKNGKYTYDEVIEMATEMENDFEKWYEQSPLPSKPDRNKIKELYFKILGL